MVKKLFVVNLIRLILLNFLPTQELISFFKKPLKR